MAAFGVRLPDNLSPVQLMQSSLSSSLKKGFGETACYVVNDLLNKELIKRNFRFEEPLFAKDEGQETQELEEQMVEEEEVKLDHHRSPRPGPYFSELPSS